jgi:hypothetical protein
LLALQERIAHTDDLIDLLVFWLYGFSAEDVAALSG